MSTPVGQHQREIERNLQAWRSKPLLRTIYKDFFARIIQLINPRTPGKIVEIGSGIGNIKTHLPEALCTDLFANPWIDVVCDAYELPFADGSVSHLILLDVFHHLRAPGAFLKEARRVLAPAGRVILFEPFMSWISFPVYGLLHHEPVAWQAAMDLGDSSPPNQYYAAQGNATRLFFLRQANGWPPGWEVFHAEAFSTFSYLLSGGYSKPALYPPSWLPFLEGCDRWLSRWPRLFGARALVGLRPAAPDGATTKGRRLPAESVT